MTGAAKRVAYLDGVLDGVVDILAEHQAGIEKRVATLDGSLDALDGLRRDIDDMLKRFEEFEAVPGQPGEPGPAGRPGEAGPPGADGLSWLPFGGWKADLAYPPFAVVCWNGAGWVSSDHTDPGVEPGAGELWKLLAMRGKSGQKGERGLRGEQGPMGGPGRDGADAPAIIEMRLTDSELVAVRADGVILAAPFAVRAIIEDRVRAVLDDRVRALIDEAFIDKQMAGGE